jgi:HlyD family secretion protein
MAVPEIKLATAARAGMDRRIRRKRWSPASWPLPVRLGAAGLAVVLAAFAVVIDLKTSASVLTVRVPLSQITVATVEKGIFHDLVAIRANVVPRDTVYIDAVDGGRVERVLVEPGDLVQAGTPMIELSNTNLALSVIQEESQLNQAISQLQQNEIALEQNRLSNDRALAEIGYGLVRLERSTARRDAVIATGGVSAEQRDVAADELAYYRQLQPIQVESNKRQAELRDRLLPDIHRQLGILRGNLDVVHSTLDGLIVRAPVTGRVTAIDLKVGEHRNAGQRLAEVTPNTGMKLSANIDEFYLPRVHAGQIATIEFGGQTAKVTAWRVYPQVQSGQFTVELRFEGPSPPGLVAGEAVQGRLQLGGDTPANILPVGPFLERTGGDWVFVVAADLKSAQRRRIKVGRRTTEQLEIVSGLTAGERAIVSDYTSLDKADRVSLTH